MILPFFEINGIKITRFSLEEALKKAQKKNPQRLFFVNAHTLMVSKKDPELVHILNRAEILLNDGIGIDIAAFLLSKGAFEENLNGTDFIPKLISQAENTRIFFLGAKEKTISNLEEVFVQRFPKAIFAGAFHGYFSDAKEALQAISKARPDILIVGMGVPQQEKFIDTHWEDIKKSGVLLAIGGGAIIDFLTGRVSRAPQWMQRARLEWVYRFYLEPRRLFHRYFIEGIHYIGYLFLQTCKKKLCRKNTMI